MNYDEIQQYVSALTDAEIIQRTKQAVSDLEQVAINDNGSDWHDCCYAATVIYAREMAKRKLTVNQRI